LPVSGFLRRFGIAYGRCYCDALAAAGVAFHAIAAHAQGTMKKGVLTVPITFIPASFASWTRDVPTPPAAPASPTA